MLKLPSDFCNLHFSKPISSWDEALPLGNGLMGCLIWGTSNELRLSLDRGDLWDTRASEKTKSSNFNYETLVKCAKTGNRELLEDTFDSVYREATPTKLPAGKLIFDFGKSKALSSSLTLADAHADVHMNLGEGKAVHLCTFLHACKNVGLIEIDCPRSAFEVKIENPAFGLSGETDDSSERGISAGSLKRIKYDPAQFFCEDNAIWFVQNTACQFSYGIFLSIREMNGKTLMAYTVSKGDGSLTWQKDTIQFLENELSLGYASSFNAHRDWWISFWEKSSVTLPDKLFEKNWYLTNYLFGSCSRKGCLPMPLQGVWTADNGELPPWKGDYHHDLNTELSYLHYVKANHLPEGESFLNFLWNLKDCAENFAKDFYGTDGLCMPSVMSMDGTALGGWPMYSYSPTNQIWLCQIFERHYTYTGDMNFLRERAYPYVAATGKCIAGLLIKNAEGQYELPISSSPEIHDDEQAAWLTPNSNYDLSLMIYLFTTLVRFCEILGKDASVWEEIAEHLPHLAVNKNNVLMLSPDESLMESHRHHAHAMPIYPLRQLDCDLEEERKIIGATIQNLEMLGTGWWVGYSFTWMSALYAMQRNGEGAAYQLKLFWENTCSPNGFHLNGDYKRRGISIFHYRPFTLEGNMSAADSLQEMLLKTHHHMIEPFFAIPQSWKEEGAAFKTFRGEDGMLISAELLPAFNQNEYNPDILSTTPDNRKSICTLEIKANADGEYTVVMPDGTKTPLITKAGETYTFTCEYTA